MLVIITVSLTIGVALQHGHKNKAVCVKTLKLSINCHLEETETNIEALRFVISKCR